MKENQSFVALLSARENISPLKRLVNSPSPMMSGKSTNELIEKEKDILAAHIKACRLWRSCLATNRKEDFISAFSCSVVADTDKTVAPEKIDGMESLACKT